MINLLEILKKIPNLEDMVFYSPLFNETKVKLCLEQYGYKMWIYAKNNKHIGTLIDDYGKYISDYNGECMLYPSKENRDWSTFKIPRKDLPKGTRVIVSEYGKSNEGDWTIRTYAGLGQCFYPCKKYFPDTISWNYIIPTNKFNFEYCTFKEEDNYGTAHK